MALAMTKKSSKSTLFIKYFILMSLLINKHLHGSRKEGYINILFFLFLNENVCCGYSLEAPRRDACNVYPKHKFSCRNKKNIATFLD